MITSLSAAGNTNYDAALLTAMQAFTANTKFSGPGTQNVSYFISDGDPTVGSDWPRIGGIQLQPGIQSNEEGVWRTFLADNNIVSFALGIPAVSTPMNLDPIAFDPALGTQTGDEPIIVTDLSELANALVITIPPLTASILTGAGGTASNSFGGDGGFVQSIKINDVTYTFDPTANDGAGSITASDGSSPAYDPTTKTLTVDTDTNTVGGEFAMVMTTGAFTFQPPTNFSSETIDYVLVDNDGDAAGNSLVVAVDNDDDAAGSPLLVTVASAQQPSIAGGPINPDAMTIGGNSINDPPVVANASLTLNEGESVPLGDANALVSDQFDFANLDTLATSGADPVGNPVNELAATRQRLADAERRRERALGRRQRPGERSI